MHRADSWNARTKMGALTETMTRLQGEIGVWRHERAVLQNDLSKQTKERCAQVSALCAVFARDREGAHRAWFGPTHSEDRAAESQQQQPAKEAKAKVPVYRSPLKRSKKH